MTPEQITEIANQLKSYKLESIVPKFVTGEEFLAWMETDEADSKIFDDSYCNTMVAFLKGYNRAVEYMLFIDGSSCSLIKFHLYDSFYTTDRRGDIIAELDYDAVRFDFDSWENNTAVANSIQLVVKDYTSNCAQTAKHYLDIAISYEELKQLSKEVYNL